MSLNARGIRDLQKRKSIFTWIEKQKSDITLLQETYSTPEILTDWKFQWRGEMIYSHGSNHSRGVLVLINEQLQFELKNTVIDDNGRYILLEMTIQDSPFLLLNLYAPTKLNEQAAFFEEILSVIQTTSFDTECRIIIGGDFNVHLDAALDNSGGKIETKSTVKKIQDIMLEYNLIDIWRIHNPDKRQFTWRQRTPIIQRRIDFWLISDELQDDIKKADIIPAIRTDHSAISLSVNSLKDQPFGPSYWKFNSSLLDDDTYIQLINSEYPNWITEFSEVNDPRVLWDLIKYRIRQTTLQYSKIIAKNRKARLQRSEETLKQCEEICNNNPSEENIIKLDEARSEYEALYDYVIQGKIIRSRANWYEQGEKNSKYFLNLETNKTRKTSIRRLFNSDGKLILNSKIIMKELEDFYTALYRNQDSSDSDRIIPDFINSAHIPKLSDDQKNLCEGILSNTECFNALSKFPNGKTPGNDGLTPEFYKKFWNLLGQRMTDSLNFSYLHGELSNSQKQAIIRLIEKKRKDRRYIKNWRPISLLNVDTKIASKALALRIEKVLPFIINGDQYAYVKGRTIFDAVRSIEDIMEYTRINQIPGLMVAIDFEKAFDSISWNFLLKALKSFNLGESFVKWISVFYSNISSCVINNGFSTPLFNVERGVRQGDPLSPYLFIIVLELLLIKIRSNPRIKGIKFGNVEVKLAAFADDLTTFVHDKASIEHLFSTLGPFEKCSGLKLNKDKTEAYWLGSSHNCKQNLGIETVNEPMKILGIYFTYNSRLKHELNFDAILKSLKKTLNGWQWRNLTVFGKIQIIKTFAMPKLMFRASVLNPDKEFLKKINSVMFNFLWNGKDKIKRLALISEYKDGGLKMPHVESAIKTQRIICLKKYTENYYSPWKLILSRILKDHGDKLLLHCNYNVADLPKHLPRFYRECFETWATVNTKQMTSRDVIMDQILWNNQHLRIDGIPQFCKKSYMAGIVKIKDILLPNGKLKPWNFFREKGLNLNNYFLILGLSKALPDSWRVLINSENSQPPDALEQNTTTNSDLTQFVLNCNNEEIKLNELTSKRLYWILIGDIHVHPTARLKYNSLFDDQNLDWKQIYLIPHKVTLDIKTRMFQFKILNRIIYTNQLLNKMRLTDTSLCTFCGECEESLEHLFLHCKFTKDFWTHTINWLNKSNITISRLSDSEILLGITKESPHWTLLNHILIAGKQVIHTNRLKKTKPLLPQLIAKLKYIEHIEYFIAKKRDRLKFHQQKWKILKFS